VGAAAGKLTAAQIAAILLIFGAAVYVGLEMQGAATPGTITPSGIAGTWTGSIVMQDVGPPDCSYSGPVTLDLTQQDTAITGTITIALSITQQSPQGIQCDQLGPFTFDVQGTNSGTQIQFTDDEGVVYSGSATSDLMTLNVNTAGQGDAAAAAQGAQCVEYCGYTQVIKLTRQ
jgi:hypothetical protein